MVKFSNYKSLWQARAKKFPTGLRSVLFQGLPDNLNAAIHEWHSLIITQKVLHRLPSKGRVIDIGAGYGRLSRVVLEARPDIEICGIDFNFDFCRTYRQEIGPVICADICSLPLSQYKSDGVLLVTALMYTQKNTKTTVQSVINQLKPGGIALFIEPGYELTTLLQKLNPRLKRQTTGGHSFTQESFLRLFDSTPTVILGKGSNIIFTLALPILLLLDKFLPFGAWAGKITAQIDVFLNIYARFSLHRWVMVQRYG